MGLRSGLLAYVIAQLPMSQTFAESTPAEDVIELAASRITDYIATGRRIVLTVLVKTRQQERLDVHRAGRAMQPCIAEGHTVEDDE